MSHTFGVSPSTAWLADSSLTLGNGIVCDENLRAAPRVYAAGDVACWPWEGGDELVRIEHWTNANEHGALAATNLLAELDGGAPTPFRTTPFVWSDQYDRRIQVVGRISGEHDVEVVHGTVESGAFVALYGGDGRMHGVLGVNLPKRLMAYRKLLMAGDVRWEDALAQARALEAS